MNNRDKQIQRMQHYVLGLVSIIVLFFMTFPIAYWRVSRSEKFSGLPMKSLSLEESQKPSQKNQNIARVKVIPIQPISSLENIQNFPEHQVNLLSLEKREALKEELYQTLNTTWQTYPTFTQSLLYHVNVSHQGEIIGFKPLNQVAKTHLYDIPLASLIRSQSNSNPLIPHNTFTVIFHTNGVLEINH
ncbi:MAG: hypothetical protein AAFO04_26810 [Cyanobacteria bacterium J06592_8]